MKIVIQTPLLLFNLALEDGWRLKEKKRDPVSVSFYHRRKYEDRVCGILTHRGWVHKKPTTVGNSRSKASCFLGFQSAGRARWCCGW